MAVVGIGATGSVLAAALLTSALSNLVKALEDNYL